MAANAEKRKMLNRAFLILNAGRTSRAAVFITDDVDDNYFSDPFTNVPSGQNDLKAICYSYENVLLMVLADLMPEFATKYADLGAPVLVNQEFADWDYLFELPSDYEPRLRDTVRQVSQDDYTDKYDFKILHYEGYSHIVAGTDDQTYVCSSDHTSATATKPIDGANYTTVWTLYEADDIGADWESGYAYKASRTADLLASNDLTNDPNETTDSDIDSAFIEYIPYTQAGINDKPEYYSEHFANAFCTRLAAEIALITKDYQRRRLLLQEYNDIARQKSLKVQTTRKYKPAFESILTRSSELRTE